MTQEEKQLLKDTLSVRLPYKVKINIKSDYTREMEDTELNAHHFDYRSLIKKDWHNY